MSIFISLAAGGGENLKNEIKSLAVNCFCQLKNMNGMKDREWDGKLDELIEKFYSQ